MDRIDFYRPRLVDDTGNAPVSEKKPDHTELVVDDPDDLEALEVCLQAVSGIMHATRTLPGPNIIRVSLSRVDRLLKELGSPTEVMLDEAAPGGN